MQFGGYGARLIAYVIDGVILTIALFVLVFVAAIPAAASGSQGTNAVTSLAVLIVIVLSLAYFPFFWTRSGQTPGMRPFNLYVVRDRDGGRVSGGQAVLRLIGMWVASIPFYLGFIWIFIDSRRRGWHDLIAGTVVVERRPS
jgi:uncharacterized RDD family membrane protein YckC